VISAVKGFEKLLTAEIAEENRDRREEVKAKS
jgi:hypothetical protein